MILEFGTIRFSEIIFVNHYHPYFGPRFHNDMGILGIVCIVSTPDNQHFLMGRRAKKGEWHYNRWAMPGGLIETYTLRQGIESAIMSEINEEILDDLNVSDPSIIAVSTGRLLLYFNFFVHLHVTSAVDFSESLTSNYEFINQRLEWKTYDEIRDMDDHDLFGGSKFIKHCWGDYLECLASQ